MESAGNVEGCVERCVLHTCKKVERKNKHIFNTFKFSFGKDMTQRTITDTFVYIVARGEGKRGARSRRTSGGMARVIRS